MTRIGVVGAGGLVGAEVVRLAKEAGLEPVAFSRQRKPSTPGVQWAILGDPGLDIPYWIDAAPSVSFAERRDAIAAAGAKKIVTLSSTSLLTKAASPGEKDRALTERLAQSERAVEEWATERGIEWMILRPTLIYGLGRDRNIRAIATMIRRFGFFPLFGAAAGKRQPVHTTDLAQGCINALMTDCPEHIYNVSGAEVLTYREMVRRIFVAMGRRPVMPSVPLSVFRAALLVINLIPKYAAWTPEMAGRMNQDMVFDHSAAAKDFGFTPRPFTLSRSEVF